MSSGLPHGRSVRARSPVDFGVAAPASQYGLVTVDLSRTSLRRSQSGMKRRRSGKKALGVVELHYVAELMDDDIIDAMLQGGGFARLRRHPVTCFAVCLWWGEERRSGGNTMGDILCGER